MKTKNKEHTSSNCLDEVMGYFASRHEWISCLPVNDGLDTREVEFWIVRINEALALIEDMEEGKCEFFDNYLFDFLVLLKDFIHLIWRKSANVQRVVPETGKAIRKTRNAIIVSLKKNIMNWKPEKGNYD